MSHLTNWKCSECTGPVNYLGLVGNMFKGMCSNLNCNAINHTPLREDGKDTEELAMDPAEVLAVARSVDAEATIVVTHDETIVRCRSVYAELVRDAIAVKLGRNPSLPEHDRVEITYNWKVEF